MKRYLALIIETKILPSTLINISCKIRNVGKICTRIPTLLIVLIKVLGKVWPGFKNKYDLDVYDLR